MPTKDPQKRAAQRKAKYANNAAYREYQKETDSKYRTTALYQATRRKYRNTPDYKAKYSAHYYRQYRAARCAYLLSLLDPTTFSKELERCRTETEKLRLCRQLVAAWHHAGTKAREVLPSLKGAYRRRTSSPR